ncbi:hypothetical protein E8E13_006284 [Curvularia kusanoi]|uniref:Uncharacterized protein n=1 Tax=Curvularia kusanoi TaxID=90978 RepID=A0A9P4TGE9_CURKU|nr:hypothetical protein E8E13_006284 [Curvularia kusanoi]
MFTTGESFEDIHQWAESKRPEQYRHFYERTKDLTFAISIDDYKPINVESDTDSDRTINMECPALIMNKTEEGNERIYAFLCPTTIKPRLARFPNGLEEGHYEEVQYSEIKELELMQPFSWFYSGKKRKHPCNGAFWKRVSALLRYMYLAHDVSRPAKINAFHFRNHFTMMVENIERCVALETGQRNHKVAPSAVSRHSVMPTLSAVTTLSAAPVPMPMAIAIATPGSVPEDSSMELRSPSDTAMIPYSRTAKKLRSIKHDILTDEAAARQEIEALREQVHVLGFKYAKAIQACRNERSAFEGCKQELVTANERADFEVEKREDRIRDLNKDIEEYKKEIEKHKKEKEDSAAESADRKRKLEVFEEIHETFERFKKKKSA